MIGWITSKISIVLSKLRYFSQSNAATHAANVDELQSAVARYLEGSIGPTKLTPVVGSTLGICFRADTLTKPFFVKTHRPDESSRENLLKEFDILEALYRDRIFLHRFDVELASDQHTCILMEWLDTAQAPPTPAHLRAIIGECYETLEHIHNDRATQFSTIGQLVAEGDRAIFELEELQLVSPDTALKIRPCLNSLKNAISHLRPIVCHGDLSNKNLLASRGQNIIIDWEDSFLGFAGYDYLYWLTFMDNRKYLSPSVLGYTALGEASERGVMLMIVAIKSLISVRSKAVQFSRVPIERRLVELLTF
jgi:hypothetical protein